ncbi:C40 family peptidase [Ornithinimicrobium faecis]|uniref:C40 family peptidase n=1 Tax=Ornithinimicrobium faecis TaxID=2934158 RepID=UPI0021189DBE|nr:C40 family peptidase [Ornithinimicrobium sp. HY1745]
MTHRIPGRHRAPSRLTAAGTTISRSAKTTAVVATSGGLLATVVAPASANPQGIVDEVASVVSGNQFTATPAVDRLAANMPIMAEPTDLPAVAVAAPEDVETDFGSLGFTGVTPVVEEEPVVEAAPVTEAAAAPEATTDVSSAPSATTDSERSNDYSASRSEERAEAPVQEQAPAPRGGGVIGVAASYVGYPYVYGGGSPSGFDCSGYTSYVFAQVGINLPRSASAQQAYATPVSNPQPGDLVFWGYPAYHVGIYAGNGMVYDAGNPGVGVTYRSVFSGVSGYGRV